MPGTGPLNSYIGKDFRKAYAPGVTLDGTGQMLGIVAFDGYNASDIVSYDSIAQQPNVPLFNVLVDGFNGIEGTPPETEVPGDIEMANSMAPGLSKIVVFEAPYASKDTAVDWVTMLDTMATYTSIKQFSCSWFWPYRVKTSPPAVDAIFRQMDLQGQSFFNASGDGGSYGSVIPFPADNPYITQVGGTTLTTTSSGGLDSVESVWNGSGGGISRNYAIPFYQNAIDMSRNGGSTTMRNIPDVALVANNIYVFHDRLGEPLPGTSYAAPLWAGFLALVNQQLAAQGVQNPYAGFVNPAIYSIGNSSRYASDFHDTLAGNNGAFKCDTAHYDLCNRLGNS